MRTRIRLKTCLCHTAQALQEKSHSWDVPLSFHPLTLLVWVPMVEGSTGGGAGAADPQNPVAAGDTGDIGSASQALDCVCLLSGQTTHGVNTGSFLGASSSWPCCSAHDGCAVVTRMGSKPGGQTPKEILESPEPLMKYKSEI